MSEPTIVRREVVRIRKNGDEARQILQHIVDLIHAKNCETIEALVAAGFDRREVNAMILEWWRVEGVSFLRQHAVELEAEFAASDAATQKVEPTGAPLGGSDE